ncbi:unnamed protein product [Lymnaea stagnalis]|uniref:EF-hand domain-containing protein n=1 Tax=Lymnaea stagnalis TaxID=6523 RepID=A0AAV2I9U4_LYMST
MENMHFIQVFMIFVLPLTLAQSPELTQNQEAPRRYNHTAAELYYLREIFRLRHHQNDTQLDEIDYGSHSAVPFTRERFVNAYTHSRRLNSTLATLWFEKFDRNGNDVLDLEEERVYLRIFDTDGRSGISGEEFRRGYDYMTNNATELFGN